jgi:anti-sigma factor RsiW
MNDHDMPLSAFVDGALTGEERQSLDAHLAGCPDCRRCVEELRLLKRRLAAAPRRAMPPDLIAATLARIDSPWALLRGLARPTVAVPAFALAAAALIVGFWFNASRGDQFVPLEPLLAAHSRYTAESLVPEDNLVAGSYSRNLTEYYSDDTGQE